MRRVLVTGVAGLIGSHLSEALLARGDAVIGLDDFSRGSVDNLATFAERPGFSLVRGDVCDQALVRQLCVRVEAVVHLAAWKIPRYGQAREMLEVNGLGTWTVLNAAAAAKRRVVVASTSDIYGRNPTLPFGEDADSVLGPTTVRRWGYAVSKLFGEHLCWAFHREAGLPVSVVRYFGGYGPRQRLDWMAGPQAVFIGKALRGEALPIHGTGEQRRTFTYVSDHVDGTLKVLDSERAIGEALNLGGTEDISILELGRLIWRLIHGDERPPKMEAVPYERFGGRYEDVQRRVPEVTKAKALLDFEAKVPLVEGLKATIAWQREVLEGVSVGS